MAELIGCIKNEEGGHIEILKEDDGTIIYNKVPDSKIVDYIIYAFAIGIGCYLSSIL
jgi:hypothetical protein